jgi:hypothetical protein
LGEFFGDHIISRKLYPLYLRIYGHWIFIFRGLLKEKMEESNLHTSEELKQNTLLSISNVITETFHLTAPNMRKRADASIAERGGHFQRFIRLFLF